MLPHCAQDTATPWSLSPAPAVLQRPHDPQVRRGSCQPDQLPEAARGRPGLPALAHSLSAPRPRRWQLAAVPQEPEGDSGGSLGKRHADLCGGVVRTVPTPAESQRNAGRGLRGPSSFAAVVKAPPGDAGSAIPSNQTAPVAPRRGRGTCGCCPAAWLLDRPLQSTTDRRAPPRSAGPRTPGGSQCQRELPSGGSRAHCVPGLSPSCWWLLGPPGHLPRGCAPPSTLRRVSLRLLPSATVCSRRPFAFACLYLCPVLV